jgi:ABC-type tungstate transport system substrate-binding protein
MQAGRHRANRYCAATGLLVWLLLCGFTASGPLPWADLLLLALVLLFVGNALILFGLLVDGATALARSVGRRDWRLRMRLRLTLTRLAALR